LLRRRWQEPFYQNKLKKPSLTVGNVRVRKGVDGAKICTGGADEIMKILVADGNRNTAAAVGECCFSRWPHHQVVFTDAPEQFLLMVEQDGPDVVLLDSELGGGRGPALCREVRHFSAVPLIMMLWRGEENEVVRALESGADDCLTRPLRPKEVVARLVALLRRSGTLPMLANAGPVTAGPLYMDFNSFEVRFGGEEVHLTATEFEILRHLVNNRRWVVSHAQLSEAVWGDQESGSRNSLKVHIQHLRQKLGEGNGHPRFIFNARGLGYKFNIP